MKTAEAIEICEGWFAHIERQRQKSVEVQRLAKLARTDQVEAQRLLRILDRTPTVYDGARLEPAVRALLKLVRTGNTVARATPLTHEELTEVCKRFVVEGSHGDYLEDDGYHLAKEIERIVRDRYSDKASE